MNIFHEFSEFLMGHLSIAWRGWVGNVCK